MFIMEIIPLVRDKERVTYRRKSLGYMMYLEFWISKVQRKKIIRLDNIPYHAIPSEVSRIYTFQTICKFTIIDTISPVEM